jgi:hypothetical protein
VQGAVPPPAELHHHHQQQQHCQCTVCIADFFLNCRYPCAVKNAPDVHTASATVAPCQHWQCFSHVGSAKLAQWSNWRETQS